MSKYTPKIFYKTSKGGIQTSSCRLCLKISDVTHKKVVQTGKREYSETSGRLFGGCPRSRRRPASKYLQTL